MISYDVSAELTNCFNYLHSLKEMLATSTFYSINKLFTRFLRILHVPRVSPQSGSADSQGKS